MAAHGLLMALEALFPNNRRVRIQWTYPQQEFFISYGEAWCSNATPQYLSMMAQSIPMQPQGARERCGINMLEFRRPSAARRAAHGAGKRLSRLVESDHEHLTPGLRIQARSVL
jgi:hypothetical protein